MEKIDIYKVFRDHFRTLRHYDKERISFFDILLFLIAPFVIGYFSAKFIDLKFIIANSQEIITFYSVFGGFMLNLLALIYSFDLEKFRTRGLAVEVLNQIVANILYLVALSSILIFLMFIILASETFISATKANFWLTAFLIGIFFNFALTTLMIIKRFHSLDSNREY
jgi:hypothetical protein